MGLAAVAWPILMARSSHPLVPLSLFKSRNFTVTNISTQFGSLADRYGPRVFMAAGPALMGLGLLWYVRTPSGSSPWVAELGDPSTLVPPSGYLIDFLPGQILFGVGLMVMVAPLTTALMRSVPVEHSGVASAFNNAVSRVGPQLAGALIFIAVSASFFAALQTQLPEVDGASSEVRY